MVVSDEHLRVMFEPRPHTATCENQSIDFLFFLFG
jgi:hypothetical protein